MSVTKTCLKFGTKTPFLQRPRSFEKRMKHHEILIGHFDNLFDQLFIMHIHALEYSSTFKGAIMSL